MKIKHGFCLLPSVESNISFRYLLLAVLVFYLGQRICFSQVVALPTAFAHNDYRHKHPLQDALKNGFTYVEADIFLCHSRLLVLHSLPFFKKQRTLEHLYLDPLSVYLGHNQKAAQTSMDTLVLMIDIKSNGQKTVAALKEKLAPYKDLLSTYENGHLTRRNITIVLSGHRPLTMLRAEKTHFLFVDEHLPQVNNDNMCSEMYAMASCKYARLLSWRGKGKMPDDERKRLCTLVSKAHEHGKKVRLWASPENEKVWTELLSCGVDLINTNKLEAYRRYWSTTMKPSMAIAADKPLDLE